MPIRYWPRRRPQRSPTPPQTHPPPWRREIEAVQQRSTLWLPLTKFLRATKDADGAIAVRMSLEGDERMFVVVC